MSADSKDAGGWTRARIGDLVKPHAVSYGIVKAGPFVDSGVPMIRVGDIRDGHIQQEGLYRVSPDVAMAYQRTTLVGSEVLITVQGSVGRTALVPDSLRGANVSRTVAVLRFEDPMMAAWVHYALQTEPMQREIRRLAAASTKDLLNLRDLRELSVYLAPPDSQRRLISSVQEATHTFRETVAAGDSAIQEMETLLENLPVEAYEGRLTRSEGWLQTEVEVCHLADAAESSLGKMLDRSSNRGTPRPYLRNANVKWGAFDLTDIYSMPIADEDRERYRLRPDDVLVCEGGEPGRAAVWHGDSEMYYQKALHRVRCGPDLDAEWLVLSLRAQATSGALRSYFTGSGIMHLTARSLARVTLSLPPLDIQRRTVLLERQLSSHGKRILDELRATLDATEATYRQFLTDSLLPAGHTEFGATAIPGNAQTEPTDRPEVLVMEYPKLAPSSRRDRGVAEGEGLPTIRAVLSSLGGRASAIDVLNSSHYGADIDGFYLQLRKEVIEGSVIEIHEDSIVRVLGTGA